MSFDRAIAAGKEKRVPYRRARASDRTCRNRGSCSRCLGDRTFQHRRVMLAAEADLRDDLIDLTTPDPDIYDDIDRSYERYDEDTYWDEWRFPEPDYDPYYDDEDHYMPDRDWSVDDRPHPDRHILD